MCWPLSEHRRPGAAGCTSALSLTWAAPLLNPKVALSMSCPCTPGKPQGKVTKGTTASVLSARVPWAQTLTLSGRAGPRCGRDDGAAGWDPAGALTLGCRRVLCTGDRREVGTRRGRCRLRGPSPASTSLGGLRGAQEGVNAPAFPLRLPGGRGPAEPTEAAALIQLLGVFPAHPELGTGCGEKQGLVSSSFPVPVGGGRAQTLKVPYGQVLTRVNACPLPGSLRPPHGCPGWGLPVGGLSQEPWCRRQSWAETRPFRFLGRHLIGLLISV